MEAFFPDLLDIFLSAAFLEKVGKKYHYWDTQTTELYAVAEELLPLIRREACWERREACGRSGAPMEKYRRYQMDVADAVYEEVVMSLGSGLDDLQESYTNRGMLSESYMLEVLADELLLEGYGAYNRYIRENTGWHVARYHFFGSEEGFPLEMLPELLDRFAIPVTCNEVFCMQPKKSVAFVSELTQDAGISCRGICMGCNSAGCPNRIGIKKIKIRG